MELIWDGKYDEQGKRVPPLKIALPFQTVETVNESAADRNRNLDLFADGGETDWRNRLIWGDKKYVLPSLLPEFAGKVNLIYIDPPFDTGADFSFTTTIPDSDASFVKEPSVIEQKAYRDTWGKGLDSYLKWFSETIVLLRELLAEDGGIYVHLDYHVAHYAKVILDEVFGVDRMVNEVIWKRQTAKGDVTQGARHMGRIHETIFLYSKSENYAWNVVYTPYDQSYIDDFYRHLDQDGRKFQLGDITAPGKATKGNPYYEFLGVTRYWRFSKERMQELYEQGRIVQTTPGSVPRQKRYLDEMPGIPLQSLWIDIPPVQSQSGEVVNYATQKPEALLERILKASSSEGDLILDCFCGSGTTAAVAEKLGRRWITCDLGRFAIHTARKRLLGTEGVKPFVVQNLGKYERQAWQTAEFGVQAAQVQQNYRAFILQLYRATPLSGFVWLHGVKNGRRVHVGSVDSAVSMGDITQIVLELRKAVGTGDDAPTSNGIDVLGWDFAFELNETAKQQAGAAGIDLRLVRIPREVLEKKAVEQGDIRFFELAALEVDVKQSKQTVTLRLEDFCIPPDDVPADIQKVITHWEQWVDYWAIDWDFRGDTFHNQWQAYRTRKEKTLQKQIVYTYAEPGAYQIVVKVIDILGNDTTKALKVTV